MSDSAGPDDFDNLDFGEPDVDCDETSIMRATVRRDGRVDLTSWMPGLIEGGPAAMHFRARERAGVAIADLRLFRNDDGDREVIVEFMAAGRVREAAATALCTWAASTGHRRVWLPDGPVELDAPPPLATATVRCPTCRARWSDSTPAFWEAVIGQGHFPLICPACAHTLPQWQVEPVDATRCRGG